MWFKGRVAIVTGGRSGIGRSVTLALADERAKVLIYDLDGVKAREVSELLLSREGGAVAIQRSVADERQVQAMVDKVIWAYGTVDILVNSAGILGRKGPSEEMSTEDWEKVIKVNLTGVFICYRAVLPHMKGKRYGKIIIIGSTAGQRMGVLGGLPYASSKPGLNSLTRHLAFEVEPFGINVNMELPGPVATSMRQGDGEPKYARERQVPMGRLIDPGEVAEAVVFLASEKAILPSYFETRL
jgi:NAD(P)-dependent dehydrogenase (short-subunit alcohol dehydrogenase family)